MNIGDCSVNSNPLAQLNKHTQAVNNVRLNNSNLGRYKNNTFKAPLEGLDSQDSFGVKQHAMSPENKAQFDSIMSVGSPKGYTFSMNISQPKSLIHNLKSSFDEDLKRNMPILNLPNTTTNSNMHDWASEFQNDLKNKNSNSPQQSLNTNRNNNSMQKNSYFSPNYQYQPNNNYSLHSGNPLNTRYEQTSKNEKSEQELWDKHFTDLEKEVSEKLFISQPNSAEKQKVNNEETLNANEYQDQFQKVWQSIQNDAQDLLPDDILMNDDPEWQSIYENLINETRINNTIKQYQFQSQNNFLSNPNSYEIGCALMENGAKLSEAALAFEAAVQENPNHVDAWLRLGLVQTQNEKEIIGISALEQCLRLEPKNLDAMKTLAISYINEGHDLGAFMMLSRWSKTKYPNIITKPLTKEETQTTFNLEGDYRELNQTVTRQFLQLANSLPNIDADVHLGLGLLYYTVEDFDKTIDCFKTALAINPNDELMWNRLGASLANSNRSEDAVAAYHQALYLKPSFVRARYNLAISSINIGCYKEATEQLLTALSMHEVDGVFNPELETNFSSNQLNNSYKTNNGVNSNSGIILDTLKRAFISMNRLDLLDLVKPGMNLQQFRSEFNF